LARVKHTVSCHIVGTGAPSCRVSLDVTPSAVHVGNIIQGMRLASAQGRDIGVLDDDTDAAKKV